MDYTIPYKGYRIKLLGNYAIVSTPKHLGGVTFLRIDTKQLAKDLGTYPNLDIQAIYKLVDAKIEEVAKQKIEDAIKANNSSHVRAIFIGEDGSMGFYNGQQYILDVRLSPTAGYVVADIHRRPTACPYSSIEAILRNWTIIM